MFSPSHPPPPHRGPLPRRGAAPGIPPRRPGRIYPRGGDAGGAPAARRRKASPGTDGTLELWICVPRGSPGGRAAEVGGGDYFLAAQGSREGDGVPPLRARASGRHYGGGAVRGRWRRGVSRRADVGSAAEPPSASVLPAGSRRADGRWAAGGDAALRRLQVDGGGTRCLLSSNCAFVCLCLSVCLYVCTFSALAQNTVSASCQNRAGLKGKVLRVPPERALLADVAAGTAGLGMCQQPPLVSAQIHIVMAVFSIYADGIHIGAVVV